jgi:predicted ATPase/DNA-binding SARP family transcriptional activator
VKIALRMLGPLEVDCGGTPVMIGGGKERALLVVLALQVGRVVSVDRLIESLWAEEPPRSPAVALRMVVSRARKALELATPDEVIVTRSPGYALSSEMVDVDVARFELLVSLGRAHLAQGQYEAAADSLASALRLWHGDALAEATGDRLQAEATRLTEARLLAAEARIEADAACGRHVQIVGELEELCRRHVLRERLWAQLMVVLYRCGRQAEALRVYQDLRIALRDELGIDPSPELRALESAVLAQDPALAAPPFEGRSAVRLERPASAGNLPGRAGRVIGRGRQIDELATLLSEPGVVTLTGTGGVGKTTLARATAEVVAEQFMDGVWWVEFGSLPSGSDVAPVVAGVLGVVEQSALGVLETVAQALREQHLLVVLDNCEHVSESVVDLVTTLRARCGGVTMLATSRRRLVLDGERDIAVRPLGVAGDHSDALQLVLERIGDRAVPNVPSEWAALVALTARLDGLPLALELAAGRCRTMAPSAVLARLTDRFRLFGGDRQGRSTLWGTVQWSFDLLGQSARQIAARLSVFGGTFSIDAAETVSSDGEIDEYQVDDAVTELVELGLLDYHDNRYSMLETTREFCREQLPVDTVDVFRDRHVAWVIDLLTAAHAGLRGRDELRWVDRLDAEWANVRVAFHRLIAYDDPTLPTTFATLLRPESWFRRPEAVGWTMSIYERFKDVDHELAHDLVGAAGEAAWSLGAPGRALELGERAMAMRPPGAPNGDYLPEEALWCGLCFSGRPLEALEVAQAQSVSDDDFQAIMGDCGEMLLLTLARRADEAGPAVGRALKRAHRLGNPSMLAFTKVHQSFTMIHERREQAEVAAEAVSAARSVRNRYLELTGQLAWAWGAHGTGATNHDVQLAVLDAAHGFVRGGWLLMAWHALSQVALELGRGGDIETASLLAHAVRQSPAGPATSSWLEPYMSTWASGIEPPKATQLARQGEHIDVGDALRIAERAVRAS